MRLTVSEHELKVIATLIKSSTWNGDSIIPVASLLSKVERGLSKMSIDSIVVETDDNRRVLAPNG